MKILSSLLTRLHRLHLGLYLLFSLMVGLGGTTAFLFEKYSLIDMGLARTEWERALDAQAKGTRYELTPETQRRIFKPFSLDKRVTYTKADRKLKKRETYVMGGGVGSFYFIFLAIWLWPLYRWYFGKKPPAAARIEKRIINLPLAVFALSWLIALQRCAQSLIAYSASYGAVPWRVKLVFAVSALLMGAFVSYLNLELTGMYIRRRIAGPFFAKTNPYGLKHGLAVNLTLRYALMMFSLGMVPLLLCLYVPAFASADIFARIAASNGKDLEWALSYENLRVLAPLAIVAALVAVMLLFQLVSILLYRVNVQVPISALVRRMKAVAAGDFSCKTSVLYADELGQLKGHFNMMLDGLVERDRIKDTFGRYVSMEIAEKIMKSGRVNLAGEEIQATVLFSDIRGFTPLSEKLPPAELIRFLNEYFSYITRPITEHRGVINKFMGDAVMAIFSPVFGVEDHQAAALRAALGMRAALAEFNAQGRHPKVNFGVGVHSGPLVAGNVGTEERLEYTVLGDTVNVASRIESQTKAAGTQILFSEAAVSGLDRAAFPGVSFSECAPVLMKGKSRPMVLYKVA